MIDKPVEGCKVSYMDDFAVVTLTVHLEYHSEHPEEDAFRSLRPHSPAFRQLADAVEKYVVRTLGPDTSAQGKVLKPRLHEALCSGLSRSTKLAV
jgi:hypothetical protein